MGKQPKSKKTATAASTTRRVEGRKEEDENNDEETTNTIDTVLEFPKSDYCIKAMSFFDKGNRYKFKKLLLQGSAKGCINCLTGYATNLLYSPDDQLAINDDYGPDFELKSLNRKDLHLAFSFCLEGAIRGNGDSIGLILAIHVIIYPLEGESSYEMHAIYQYWQKFYDKQGFGSDLDNKMTRKSIKTDIGNICHGCDKEESDTVTLKKCGGCNFYYYCSADCQKKMWLNGGHAGECRQLAILKQYHRPHGKHIRDRLVNGVDPKDIPELQELRRQLGLDRPKAEYEDLLQQVKSGRIEPCDLIVPNKDGTVQIGSFPRPM